MQEAFLQFLWRYQKFKSPKLTTSSGESLQVLQPGFWNATAGPDFLHAKIRVGEVHWTGHVEVHRKSSDWWHHRHHEDPNYDAVVLHVVWEHDGLVFSPSGAPIPTLILPEFVSRRWLDNYQMHFVPRPMGIPCAASIRYFPDPQWDSWKEKLLIERLDQKTAWIFEQLQQTQNDWEAVLFRLLARSFGLDTNGSAFAEVAQYFPFSVFRKLSRLTDKEALLLGSSGLIPQTPSDAYALELQTSFTYLQRKFQLQEWSPPTFSFARLRPSNFPTLRWALLAALYHKIPQPFRKLVEAQSPEDLSEFKSVKASDYWNTHFNFGRSSPMRIKKISRSFLDLLLINCFIPMRFAFFKSQLGFEPEQHLDWYRLLKAEKNRVVTLFKEVKVPIESAACSQGLLQLYRVYCRPKKCLSCAVGFYLMHE